MDLEEPDTGEGDGGEGDVSVTDPVFRGSNLSNRYEDDRED